MRQIQKPAKKLSRRVFLKDVKKKRKDHFLFFPLSEAD